MDPSASRETGKDKMGKEEAIPEDELEVVNLMDRVEEGRFSELEGRVVIGKVMSQKPVNKTGVKNSLKTLWEDIPDIKLTEVTTGVFAFTFVKKEHATEILERRPWSVLNALFSIQPWNFNVPYQEVNFAITPFWVQFHGLPLNLLNVDAVKVIGTRVGRVLEIENPVVDDMVVRTFARVKLEINTTKPLWAGSWVRVGEDTKVWVGFKYEQLVGLCFNCGTLGHEQRICKQPKAMASYDKNKPKYGPFLTAMTPRPIEWLLTENRLSGVQGYQQETPILNRANVNRMNEGEVGESLASNDLNAENTEQGEAVEGIGQGTGYNLRSRMRGRGQGGKKQGLEVGDNSGAKAKNKVDEGSSAGVTRQVGYIERPSEDDDPHQLVLYTKTLDGMNLEARDLLEIDTEGSKWIEIGQDGTIKEMETGQTVNEPVIYPGAEAEKLKEVAYTQVSSHQGNIYYIEFPEEDDDRKKLRGLTLDGATEDELIGTWNERLSLKRDRQNMLELEAVEEELLRRKKQKREAWYDADGRMICVTISDEFGTTTLVRNEQGRLEPNKH